MFNRSKIKELETEVSQLKETLGNMSCALDDMIKSVYFMINKSFVGKYFKITETVQLYGCNRFEQHESYIKVKAPQLTMHVACNVIQVMYSTHCTNKKYGICDSMMFDVNSLHTEITKEEYKKVLKEAVKQKYNI